MENVPSICIPISNNNLQNAKLFFGHIVKTVELPINEIVWNIRHILCDILPYFTKFGKVLMVMYL